MFLYHYMIKVLKSGLLSFIVYFFMFFPLFPFHLSPSGSVVAPNFFLKVVIKKLKFYELDHSSGGAWNLSWGPNENSLNYYVNTSKYIN